MKNSFLLTSVRIGDLLLALLLGALNVLAFAPFHWWPLQILTLAGVMRLALRQSPLPGSALIGAAYGFGWMAAGVHWLYISMHVYGGMPSWMAALAVALLALYLSLYPALATGLSNQLRQRWQLSPAKTLLLVFPALWTLGEWLRGWIFTGFPWISSGYAHSVGPLAGYAPLAGVYGLGLLTALTAGCLALLPAKKYIAPVVAVLAVGLMLKTMAWTHPAGKPLSVSLLQGNVPQEMKFEPAQISNTLHLYRDMIAANPADLVATPETALPILSNRLPADYVEQLAQLARKSNSHLLLGIPVSDSPVSYANSVLGLAPGKPVPTYRYDKHHLVPFGEFIPTGFRWFVDMMNIPLGDFMRGKRIQAPFQVDDQWILPNICYEDLFGEEIAAQLAAGRGPQHPQASILLNVSNIAWFGDTIAVPQHLQISQMRSLETGRPMLRATNTGATAVITAQGDIASQLPPYERGVLKASVQGYAGLTPYTRYGNWLVVILSLTMLMLAGLLRRRPSRIA